MILHILDLALLELSMTRVDINPNEVLMGFIIKDRLLNERAK